MTLVDDLKAARAKIDADPALSIWGGVIGVCGSSPRRINEVRVALVGCVVGKYELLTHAEKMAVFDRAIDRAIANAEQKL